MANIAIGQYFPAAPVALILAYTIVTCHRNMPCIPWASARIFSGLATLQRLWPQNTGPHKKAKVLMRISGHFNAINYNYIHDITMPNRKS